MRNTKKNPYFTNYGTGFRSVPSKIGQMIGHVFSPAVFNNEKMRAASLAYYVGDKRTILTVAPKLHSLLDQLPTGKILFFHCEKDSLTKNEICDFFNHVCSDIGFKLTPDTLKELGTIPYSKGIGVNLEGSQYHTYYGFDLDPYESTTKDYKTLNAEIHDNLPHIIKMNEKDSESVDFKNADFQALIGNSDDFAKYLRNDPQAAEKLKPGIQYLAMCMISDESKNKGWDEKFIAKVANDINASVGGKLKDGEYSPEDVVFLRTLRKACLTPGLPENGKICNYDFWAVRVG